METTKAYQLIILFIKTLVLFITAILLVYVSLPNPVFSLPLFIFVAFVPLFILNSSLGNILSFIINFIFFLMISLAALFPLNIGDLIIDVVTLRSFISIIAIIALTYSCSLTLATFICKKYNHRYSPIFYGGFWVAISYVMTLLPLQFPLPIEAVLVPYIVFLQSTQVLGPYFIILLIIATNSLIAELILKNQSKVLRVLLFCLIIIHFANVSYGYFSLNFDQNRGDKVSISVIQPNITPKQYVFMQNKYFENRMNDKMISLTNSAQKKKPELVIWPELSGNYILENKRYLARLHREITSKGTELLIGTYYREGKKIYNASAILRKNGNVSHPYLKNRLFPISETNNYENGTEFNPLSSETKIKEIGCLICIESIYPQVAKNLVKNGAKILVLISNDNCFGNSVVPYLHKNLMVLRAIENNRFGIHADINGPSLIVDNKGRVICESKYGATAFLSADIKAPARP